MSDASAGAAHAGLTLARAALLAVLGLAVPVVGIAAALRGTAGLIAASAGLGLVLVLFGASALLQAWAARLSPQAWAGVAAGGFGARLALYTLALAGLARVEGLHWPSLAAATVVGLVVTLAVEMRVLSTHPEMFWLRPARSTEGADR